ncbi:MAG: ABC transporter ATP-binding protein, partial [Lachnospiraceae bacterium]|nr:ABC transporter ATP-binding protein [Lachnospiraceae bacterium]
ILENALNEYEGTVFFVSHDRYFINSVATRILDLTKAPGSDTNIVINYVGNYDYYVEKKAQLLLQDSADAKDASKPDDASSDNKNEWEQQKAEKARLQKLERDLKKCEEDINSLETRQNEINELLTHDDIATDVSKCTELTDKLDDIASKLETLYGRWEKLSEGS